MNNTAGLEDILVKHYNKYPYMKIQDMIKLIYQNEYAGGHMIADREESLARLKDEYLSMSGGHSMSGDAAYPGDGSVVSENGGGFGSGRHMSEKGKLFEDIGNGLCRIHLAELSCHPISLETVNNFFVYTANSSKGDIGSFKDKLGVLRNCCEKGILPFDVGELDEYLDSYSAQGYPAVSHSIEYREAYYPAYRVVESDFCRYFDVFCRIDELLGRTGSFLHHRDHIAVAIDGCCCSGKSTLAALLNEVYECNVFHMDDFFLTPELRTEERLNEVGGNVDYIRFKNEVIRGLESGNEFCYQIYSCSKKAIDGAVCVTPKRLNIIEGSYSMHPTLSEYYDLKIFLSIEADEQSRRILKRNGPVMHKRFMEEWVPKENSYFEKFGIASKCDIVIL